MGSQSLLAQTERLSPAWVSEEWVPELAVRALFLQLPAAGQVWGAPLPEARVRER